MNAVKVLFILNKLNFECEKLYNKLISWLTRLLYFSDRFYLHSYLKRKLMLMVLQIIWENPLYLKGSVGAAFKKISQKQYKSM